jgi:hypothetical protein
LPGEACPTITGLEPSRRIATSLQATVFTDFVIELQYIFIKRSAAPTYWDTNHAHDFFEEMAAWLDGLLSREAGPKCREIQLLCPAAPYVQML